jgi:aspartate racemase
VTALEILHVADAVRVLLRQRGALGRSIGLMATRATLRSGFFEQRLPEVRFVTPSEATQRQIDTAIAAVKAGDVDGARHSAAAAAQVFLEEGAELLLLACTELPVALAGTAGPEWLDASDALAHACVTRSLGGGA